MGDGIPPLKNRRMADDVYAFRTAERSVLRDPPLSFGGRVRMSSRGHHSLRASGYGLPLHPAKSCYSQYAADAGFDQSSRGRCRAGIEVCGDWSSTPRQLFGFAKQLPFYEGDNELRASAAQTLTSQLEHPIGPCQRRWMQGHQLQQADRHRWHRSEEIPRLVGTASEGAVIAGEAVWRFRLPALSRWGDHKLH